MEICGRHPGYRHGIETMNEMYRETKEIMPVQAQATQQSRLSALAQNAGETKTKAQDETTGRTTADTENKNEPRRQVPVSPLALKFPSLFTHDAFVSVPVGLIPYVEKALAYFASLDLGVRIRSLRMSHHGAVRAETEAHEMIEIYILNNLLAVTSRVCIRCGGLLPEKGKFGEGLVSVYELDRDINTCPHCLEQYMPKLMVQSPTREKDGQETETEYPEFN